MKVKYEFVTGEIVEIEVPNDIGEVSIKLGRDIFNSDRRETSRHNSIEDMKARGNQLGDGSEDIPSIIDRLETDQALHDALNKLILQQRELIRKVYLKGMSISSIAREEGVNEGAIRNRLKKIYKKLKLYLV